MGLGAGSLARVCPALRADDLTLPKDCQPYGKLHGKVPSGQFTDRVDHRADSVEPDDKWMMMTILAAITQAWSPSSTYQQLQTVWWVPQKLH